nr:hypothetical protein BaRGS_018467 [Batillaria attramentaria]
MYNPNLREFAMWYDPPRPGSRMAVTNNGHTVQVTTLGEFYVTNGGLPNVYKTAQFHFHWGHAKHHGSEHLIDGHAYPLELHIVNYNTDLYKSIGEAATEKQGLAVLGIMFEMSEEDNPSLEPIIRAMEQVRDPEEGNQVEIDPLSLRSLLPDDKMRYFRYNGSLTTPGCFESVIWTVFEQPRPVSHRQMRMFRDMLQMRPSQGGHHKRSLDPPMPLRRSERRRERRALEVLTELGITTEEERARFRRELTHHKEHDAHHSAKLNEDDAGKTYHDTADHVHDTPVHDDSHDDHNAVAEVEVEYLQEKLVNNFRPVQPLNGRLVYRSFKLRDGGQGGAGHGDMHGGDHDGHGGGHGGDHGGHGGGHGDHGGHGGHGGGHVSAHDDPHEMQKRLKYYESVGSASSNVVSLMLLVSCLAVLFL